MSDGSKSTTTFALPRAVRIGLGCAAALLAVVALACLGAWAAGDSASDLPGWVEAIATLAAFLAAILAAVYAAGAYKLETEREGRWVTDQRMAQARLVGSWVGFVEMDATPSISAMQGVLGPSVLFKVYGVFLRNVSDLPVTNVVIDVGWHLSAEPGHMMNQWSTSFDLDVLPPSDTPLHLQFSSGADEKLFKESTSRVGGGDPAKPLRMLTEITLRFTDAQGVRWTRHPEGKLESGSP